MKFIYVIFLTLISLNTFALEFSCPKSIQTKQSLVGASEKWSEFTPNPMPNLPQNNLNTVEFSEGSPNNYGFLHPDNESGTTKWVSQWLFQDSNNIWVTCQYRGTSVMLSQKLPAGIKQCTVEGNNAKGISIQKISCS